MGLKLSIGAQRRQVAVEFDRRRVRVVGFTGSGAALRFDVATSSSADEPIDTTDAAAVGERLAAVLADVGLSGARVVMNVQRDEVVLRPLTLPPGTPDTDLAGMVRYQLGKELPFPADQAVIDHIETNHYQADDGAAGSEGRVVLAAAVRAEVVDFYRLVAAAAGVRLVQLGLRPQAIGRCVAQCVRGEAGECIAAVNLTADATEIDVFVDGGLAFSRSVPIGMPDRAVWPDERRPAVDAAIREVMLSVQSFQAIHAGGGVNAVLVSGDTGLEGDLVAALATKITDACELFNPARALSLPTGSDASAYAALLGAALTGAADPAATYDFLNPKRPTVQRDPNRDRITAAALAAMVIVAALIGARWWYLGGLSAEAKSLSGDIGRISSSAKATERLVARVGAIEDWEDMSVDWLGHWAQVSRAFPSPEEAYIRNLDTHDDGVIKFPVRAKSREVIEQIRQRLEELKGYKVNPVRMSAAGSDPLKLNYLYESTIEVQTDRAIAPTLSDEPVERPDDDGSATMLPQRLQNPRSRAGRRSRS